MVELVVVKKLCSKTEYLKYSKYILDLELENEIKQVINTLSKYYDDNPAVEGLSVDDLETVFTLQYPIEANKETYIQLFDKLRNLNVSDELQEECVNRMVEKYYAANIVGKLTDVLSGGSYNVLDEVGETVDEYTSVVSDMEAVEDGQSEFVEMDVTALSKVIANPDGLRWKSDTLHDLLGPLPNGSGILGHVFAPTNAGKTSFLADNVGFMSKQITEGSDEIILWVNNEEQGEKVASRLFNAVLGCSFDMCMQHAERANKAYAERTGNHVKVLDRSVVYISDLKKWLKNYNVRLLIIDVADRVKFSGSDSLPEHLRLAKLYEMYRMLAKEFHIPIITTGQASITDNQYLEIRDMADSKVGKASCLDFAIGINVPKDEALAEGIRYISIAKTKMKEGRHGRFPVSFDPITAHFNDVNHGV